MYNGLLNHIWYMKTQTDYVYSTSSYKTYTSLIITLKPINLTQMLSIFVNSDNIFISNTKLSLA